MAFSRFLFSSLKKRSVVSPNLIKRYGPGRDTVGQPINRTFHSSSYKSAIKTNPLMTGETKSTSYSRRHYFIPTAILGGIGGAAIFLHYSDERRAILKGQETKCECRNINGPAIGGFCSLIDTSGRMITEDDLLGNWVILYFGYTSSPDGPAELQKLAKAVNILGSKEDVKVLPIFVTLDPQPFTFDQLDAYVKEFDSRIVASTRIISALLKLIEVDGEDDLVDSSHNMYLMNPKMKYVRCFGVEDSAEELSKAVVKEIDDWNKIIASHRHCCSCTPARRWLHHLEDVRYVTKEGSEDRVDDKSTPDLIRSYRDIKFIFKW